MGRVTRKERDDLRKRRARRGRAALSGLKYREKVIKVGGFMALIDPF